jgi:hypothetical protein
MAALIDEIQSTIERSMQLVKQGQLPEALGIINSCRTIHDISSSYSVSEFDKWWTETSKGVFGQTFPSRRPDALKDLTSKVMEKQLLLRLIRIALTLATQSLSDQKVIADIGNEIRLTGVEFGTLLCHIDSAVTFRDTFEFCINAAKTESDRCRLIVGGILDAMQKGDRKVAEEWFQRIPEGERFSPIREILQIELLK